LAATAIELKTAHGGGGHVVDDHGHSDHPPSSTGLDSRKLLMWAFLASDTMLFGALIGTYMTYRGRAEQMGVGPFPFEIFDIPYTSISAFVLLMSSLTMVLAVSAIGRNDMRGTRAWILATAVLGAIFVGGQVFEFSVFTKEGMLLNTNIFSSSFYVLTGFHGLHVTLGIIWLMTLAWISFRGGLKQKDALSVEIAGLYWHFVDIVWIVIFVLVYLIPYPVVEGAGGHSEGAAEGALHVVGRAIEALPF